MPQWRKQDQVAHAFIHLIPTRPVDGTVQESARMLKSSLEADLAISQNQASLRKHSARTPRHGHCLKFFLKIVFVRMRNLLLPEKIQLRLLGATKSITKSMNITETLLLQFLSNASTAQTASATAQNSKRVCCAQSLWSTRLYLLWYPPYYLVTVRKRKSMTVSQNSDLDFYFY